jgi:adenine-specific DNA-methyltransferase
VGFVPQRDSILSYDPRLPRFANKLRKEPTPGERKLWAILKNIRLTDKVRFRRQQPIGNYIADFYCASYACVIEIDGMSHDSKIAKDHERDAFMKNLGLTVLRFSEQDAYRDPEGVAQTIMAHLSARTPPLTPPSRGGE